MIKLFKWAKDCCEITIEKTSFYFLSKMVIAFREPEQPLVIRDEQLASKQAAEFIDMLFQAGAIARWEMPETFNKMVLVAYQNALFRGVKKAGMSRLHIATKKKAKKSGYVVPRPNRFRNWRDK